MNPIILQIQEQLIQESTKATGLTIHETYLISAVVVLGVVIGVLALYIKGVHHSHDTKQDENIEKMTVAMTNSTNAINNNTKVVDMLFHKIDNVRPKRP